MVLAPGKPSQQLLQVAFVISFVELIWIYLYAPFPLCIYIYIQREREREREIYIYTHNKQCVYMQTYVCLLNRTDVCTYIDI